VNLVLVGLVIGLLIRNIQRFVGKKESYILAFATIISPIFYYHIFAISSLNNSLMLLVSLSLIALINFSEKKRSESIFKIYVGFLLFLCSILIKETFLINLFLFIIIVWQNARKRFLLWSVPAIILSMAYIAVHVLFFSSVDPNYSLTITFSKFIENILLIGSWLLAFPRGWQYGAPEPRNIFTLLVTLGMCFSFISSFITIFRKSRPVFFVSIVAIFFSIISFLFLNRILVYYLDSAFILIVILVAFATRKMSKQLAKIVIIAFCASSLLHHIVVYQQWQKYSFVSRANMTAKNYIRVIEQLDLSQYQNLCILNHTEGKWATQDGNLAHYITRSTINIISIPGKVAPRECATNSVILLNDGVNYAVVKK
jgi:hypothetical protein